MRPAKNPGKSVSSQSVRAMRRLASVTPLMPLRSSPKVNTLKYSVDAGLLENHSSCASARPSGAWAMLWTSSSHRTRSLFFGGALVTNNEADFVNYPGLVVENWVNSD